MADVTNTTNGSKLMLNIRSVWISDPQLPCVAGAGAAPWGERWSKGGAEWVEGDRSMLQLPSTHSLHPIYQAGKKVKKKYIIIIIIIKIKTAIRTLELITVSFVFDCCNHVE